MNFWKICKNEDFGLNIFYEGQILMPFSGLTPLKLKKEKIRVGYVYIEESYDTIFNMGYGGGGYIGYGSGKSPMDARVNLKNLVQPQVN